MFCLLPPLRKLTVSEQSQALDINYNNIDVIQPLSETVGVEYVNEDEEEEISIYDNYSENSGTRSSDRRSQRKITKTTRFNIGHENIKKYGYHRDIHM